MHPQRELAGCILLMNLIRQLFMSEEEALAQLGKDVLLSIYPDSKERERETAIGDLVDRWVDHVAGERFYVGGTDMGQVLHDEDIDLVVATMYEGGDLTANLLADLDKLRSHIQTSIVSLTLPLTIIGKGSAYVGAARLAEALAYSTPTRGDHDLESAQCRAAILRRGMTKTQWLFMGDLHTQELESITSDKQPAAAKMADHTRTYYEQRAEEIWP